MSLALSSAWVRSVEPPSRIQIFSSLSPALLDVSDRPPCYVSQLFDVFHLVAYGFLFGVYPSLVADTFGVHGLSQNWGWMTLAPVISGNIFNLLYGHIFDANSIINEEDGTRKCLQGIHCYKTAYWVTFGAGMFGVVVSLWSIHHDGAMKRRRRKELEERDA